MILESQILKIIDKKGKIYASKTAEKTGYSKTYVNKILQKLVDEGQIYKSGSTKNAKYIIATQENIKKVKTEIQIYNRIFRKVEGLEEHAVFEDFKRKTEILKNVSSNVQGIFDYAFTEMLNNAIEHSQTDMLNVRIEKKLNTLKFEIRDYGIGIFHNIKEKFNLASEDEAIGQLVKGKLTTARKGHSGEGIFFTSKAADTMIIQNLTKKIIFNNFIEDVFVRTIDKFKGTKVVFSINFDSARNLLDIFNKYAGRDYTFDTTKVFIKLFKGNTKYISRSEARRVLIGLEKFKTIILDFKDIEFIGQGFADEIFRVWKSRYPDTEFKIENAGDDVMFMINRVSSTGENEGDDKILN